MKKNSIPKSALAYLIVGLFMNSLTPIISRYYPISDFLKWFIMGFGLMLEMIAIVKIQRAKKEMSCTAKEQG